IATAATLVVQNLLYQLGLARSPVGVPALRQVVTFGAIALAVAGLTVAQLVFDLPLVVGLVAVAGVSVGRFLASRDSLEIGRYFPELLRIPVLRQLIGRPDTKVDGRAA
ncbi:MAG TPA: hypothetical protein VK871_09410, partial [Candidatus Limnocylindrales bacterium]|nr:hypothetical protein [Candidatus Limnocylindrales bacterium]